MSSTLIDDRKPNERSWLCALLLSACAAGLLGVAFTAVAYFMADQVGSTQVDAAASQVRGPLTNACNVYRLQNGDWPDDLHALLEKTERGGPYLENRDALRDPWGGLYHYDYRGPENDGARPDIWTIHPATGAKIGNWPTSPLKR